MLCAAADLVGLLFIYRMIQLSCFIFDSIIASSASSFFRSFVFPSCIAASALKCVSFFFVFSCFSAVFAEAAGKYVLSLVTSKVISLFVMRSLDMSSAFFTRISFSFSYLCNSCMICFEHPSSVLRKFTGSLTCMNSMFWSAILFLMCCLVLIVSCL